MKNYIKIAYSKPITITNLIYCNNKIMYFRSYKHHHFKFLNDSLKLYS